LVTSWLRVADNFSQITTKQSVSKILGTCMLYNLVSEKDTITTYLKWEVLYGASNCNL